jgi:hypothetical protein
MPPVSNTIGASDRGRSIERARDAIEIDVEWRFAARLFRPNAHYAW